MPSKGKGEGSAKKKAAMVTATDWAAAPRTRSRGGKCLTCSCDPELVAFVADAVRLIRSGRSQRSYAELWRYVRERWGYAEQYLTFMNHVKAHVPLEEGA